MTGNASTSEPLDPDQDLVEPEAVVEEEPEDPAGEAETLGGLPRWLLGLIVCVLLLVIVGGKVWAIGYVMKADENAENADWAQILELVNALDAVAIAVVGGILGIKIQGVRTKKMQEKAKKNHDIAKKHQESAVKNREAARANRAKAHQRGVAIVDAAHALDRAAPTREVRQERRLNLLQSAVPREVAATLSLDAVAEQQVGDQLRASVVPRWEELEQQPDRLDEAALARRLREAL